MWICVFHNEIHYSCIPFSYVLPLFQGWKREYQFSCKVKSFWKGHCSLGNILGLDFWCFVGRVEVWKPSESSLFSPNVKLSHLWYRVFKFTWDYLKLIWLDWHCGNMKLLLEVCKWYTMSSYVPILLFSFSYLNWPLKEPHVILIVQLVSHLMWNCIRGRLPFCLWSL